MSVLSFKYLPNNTTEQHLPIWRVVLGDQSCKGEDRHHFLTVRSTALASSSSCLHVYESWFSVRVGSKPKLTSSLGQIHELDSKQCTACK